jgi:hypothetical protein
VAGRAAHRSALAGHPGFTVQDPGANRPIRAGLAVAAIDEVALRQEGGTAVAGLLVDARSD